MLPVGGNSGILNPILMLMIHFCLYCTDLMCTDMYRTCSHREELPNACVSCCNCWCLCFKRHSFLAYVQLLQGRLYVRTELCKNNIVETGSSAGWPTQQEDGSDFTSGKTFNERTFHRNVWPSDTPLTTNHIPPPALHVVTFKND